MKLLEYQQIVFRIFGLMPLDGINFNTHKLFEIFRMCLFPMPIFMMCSSMIAFFCIHIVNIGKSTDALFAGIGSFDAALIYSTLMYRKRELFGLMIDSQILLDRSKSITI